MQYQTTINIAIAKEDRIDLDISSLVITYDAMMPTEAESVTSALAAYTATGHTAEEIISIETRACEST